MQLPVLKPFGNKAKVLLPISGIASQNNNIVEIRQIPKFSLSQNSTTLTTIDQLSSQ